MKSQKSERYTGLAVPQMDAAVKTAAYLLLESYPTPASMTGGAVTFSGVLVADVLQMIGAVFADFKNCCVLDLGNFVVNEKSRFGNFDLF